MIFCSKFCLVLFFAISFCLVFVAANICVYFQYLFMHFCVRQYFGAIVLNQIPLLGISSSIPFWSESVPNSLCWFFVGIASTLRACTYAWTKTEKMIIFFSLFLKQASKVQILVSEHVQMF